MILMAILFGFIYEENTVDVFNDSYGFIILLYLPYLILHEILHSVSYVIYGADFKNITYGAHLEKGVLCCLCKQNINKRNILYSLLYPFFFIGVLTSIIGIIFHCPVLVFLSLVNISGCSGDLVMFYHLSRLRDYEFSEFDDPTSFALYTNKDFSKLKMFGLDYVGKTDKLDKTCKPKVVVSKSSVVIIILFYLLFIFMMMM